MQEFFSALDQFNPGVKLSDESLQKIRAIIREEMNPQAMIEATPAPDDNAWLAQVRQQFKNQQPLIAQLSKLRGEVTPFFVFMRANFQYAPMEPGVDRTEILAHFDKLLSYLEQSQDALQKFASLSGSVNKIMNELDERSK